MQILILSHSLVIIWADIAINLHNVNLHDDNFDEDNPETVIHFRLMVWGNKYEQRMAFK